MDILSNHEDMKISINNKIIKIDRQCYEIVKYFNNIGLKTRYCCNGHYEQGLYVIFDDNITDKNIEDFIEETEGVGGGNFFKWTRMLDDKISSNWTYQFYLTYNITELVLNTVRYFKVYKPEENDYVKIITIDK